jgi:glutathione synthase/RimK-type ligase-like ATP-grasp enzyme
MKDVLIFFSFRKHKTGYYEALFAPYRDVGANYGLRFLQGSLKDLHIYIQNNRLRIVESMTGRDLKDFAVVHFDAWTKSPQQALAAALYLKHQNVPVTNEEMQYVLPDTKVGELARMADGDIPLPDTFTSSQREILRIFKDQPVFEYPFIAKASDVFGGKMNYLVKNYNELNAALSTNKDKTFVLQRFIPNDFDYRVIVMGGKIRLVMKRARDSQSKSHVNNTSQGAAAEFVDANVLTPKMQRDALNAAKQTLRSGFSGVDVIVDNQTGKHYILEVNDQPAIQVGANPEVKIPILMKYLQEMSGVKSEKN